MYFVVTISQTVFQVPLAPFFSLVSISVFFLITYECAIITFAPSSYSSPSSPIPYLVNHTVSLAHSYQQFFFRSKPLANLDTTSFSHICLFPTFRYIRASESRTDNNSTYLYIAYGPESFDFLRVLCYKLPGYILRVFVV